MSEAPRSMAQPGTGPVALITGAARRIGASVARDLHQAGYAVLLHHRRSAAEAQALAADLNQATPGSAAVQALDLVVEDPAILVQACLDHFGRLDALVNNASSFYPTPIGQITPEAWNDLVGSNARGPLFLAQAAARELARQQGAIVNISDIHARAPLAGHTAYVMAKAAQDMMTRSLARELAPEVRVNAVAPGAILWPEAGLEEEEKAALIRSTPLQRRGRPEDIARAVRFLLESPYITGQILAVDGGRSLA